MKTNNTADRLGAVVRTEICAVCGGTGRTHQLLRGVTLSVRCKWCNGYGVTLVTR